MWSDELVRARLHVVTGKGGTGKTTVAAALAVALASGGGRTLLVEVEGRQGIAHLFDIPPLPYQERRIAVAPGGGEVRALAVDAEEALLDYFTMFYNLGFAARTLRRMGAIEFATTLAPGLRDVLLTGKVKEATTRAANGGRVPTTRWCSTPRRPGGWCGFSTSPGRWPTWPRSARSTTRARGWYGCCTPRTPRYTWSPCWRTCRWPKPWTPSRSWTWRICVRAPCWSTGRGRLGCPPSR